MDTININEEDLKTFYSIVSNNIIRLRKEKNVSQLDLATTIGHTSATFLGKAELLAENKHFNLEHIYKIATALDVDICEFFK
ncbi:helix-turn-helix transcriptional regulator [bacterium]|jgi:transcriptional regulator with XRE-family HTH domain|nr:helix-turn-helix transcriptional regulator [bacterium]MBT4495947.1 helix-turn-helix transcriptional regulator [bacterium]MBT7118093.1 helix-turn-helix transcriptional regulator [Campylobacteraceae bacterium]MBT7830307.1 helix-turn-helix transcriptional regulator [Candidatus Neomarinimicrobiota bacterium]